MKETIVKREIVRKIKTGDFEQLDVIVGFQEKISWETEEDKKDKIDKLNKSLTEDFIKVYDEAVKTIGVDRCLGTARLVNENYHKEKDEKFKKKQSAVDKYKENSEKEIKESKKVDKEIINSKNINDDSKLDFDEFDIMSS